MKLTVLANQKIGKTLLRQLLTFTIELFDSLLFAWKIYNPGKDNKVEIGKHIFSKKAI